MMSCRPERKVHTIAFHFTVIIVSVSASYALLCSEYKEKIQPPQYYPLKHCQRSNKTSIGMTNFRHIKRCADFARSRKAMAFNFAPRYRGKLNRFDNAINSKINNVSIF